MKNSRILLRFEVLFGKRFMLQCIQCRLLLNCEYRVKHTEERQSTVKRLQLIVKLSTVNESLLRTHLLVSGRRSYLSVLVWRAEREGERFVISKQSKFSAFFSVASAIENKMWLEVPYQKCHTSIQCHTIVSWRMPKIVTCCLLIVLRLLRLPIRMRLLKTYWCIDVLACEHSCFRSCWETNQDENIHSSHRGIYSHSNPSQLVGFLITHNSESLLPSVKWTQITE